MHIEVNGRIIECQEGKKILEVLKDNGIKVPTLCYHPDLVPEGRCRMCIVEIEGKLITSCNTKVSDGMKIITNSDKVKEARKINAELLYAHNIDKLNGYEKNEFLDVIEDLGITESRFESLKRKIIDKSNPSLVVDKSKCILCGRCVQKCNEIQKVHAINYVNRGVFTKVSPAFELPLGKAACTLCGQCSLVCPTGAIREKDEVDLVEDALKDKKKHVIIQTAPSIRASIGEAFGLPPGTLVTGKMVAALKKIGFDKVFDTNLGADLTIMEEGSEFLEMVKKDKGFPLITSCSPGWVKFIEHFYPTLLKHLSSAKSPQSMFGAIVKSYYAKKFKIKPKDIVVVSAMPCTAKKFEAKRPEMKGTAYPDVDIVLTNRELARLIKAHNIDLKELDDSDFDNPLGESTGAAAIFGATGGVMEAALRTAYELATGSPVTKLEFDQIRGLEGIKEGTIIIGEKEYRFAVAHGLGNARIIMDKVLAGEKYHFIEIMACPGGCVGGGGQIMPTTKEIIQKRTQAIYEQDYKKQIRVSHKNPQVLKLYEEFLDKPLSKLSHKLLHTKYKKRSEF